MANRVKERVERKVVLTSFSLQIPLTFPVVTTETIKNQLTELYKGKRMVGLSTYLKNKFLEEQLDNQTEANLTSRFFNKEASEIFGRYKESVLKSTKANADILFQQWCESKILEFIKLKKEKRYER